MDIVEYGPCELNNYCIFQGVNDIFRCDEYGTPCSSDASNCRLDGTFICNFHLGKYFKILKSSFTIPSGKDNNRSFKMLVGQSLLPQNTTTSTSLQMKDRVLIPLRLQDYFNMDTKTAMEKFVLYSIYDEKELAKKLCDELFVQEYFEHPMWARFQYAINSIMGLVSPNILCQKPEPSNETRVFDSQENYDMYKPFLKNLINRLIRPIMLTVNGYVIKIEDKNTCTFTSKGLIVPDLHNPNIPVKPENLKLQPKFSIRTVVEFDGRATMEQRALDMYDEVILSRLLLNGSQINS